MTRKTLYADEVKAAIEKLFDTLPMISRTDLFAAIDSLPAAEPDAGERVERPPMLLASIGDGSRDVWWTRQGDDLWESQRIFGVSTHAGSKSLIVDRTASDVAALKLYDHDLAASRPSEKE